MELREFTPRDPNTCKHEDKKGAGSFFAGTIVEVCVDCMTRFDERPMTEEEADEFYGDE